MHECWYWSYSDEGDHDYGFYSAQEMLSASISQTRILQTCSVPHPNMVSGANTLQGKLSLSLSLSISRFSFFIYVSILFYSFFPPPPLFPSSLSLFLSLTLWLYLSSLSLTFSLLSLFPSLSLSEYLP